MVVHVYRLNLMVYLVHYHVGNENVSHLILKRKTEVIQRNDSKMKDERVRLRVRYRRPILAAESGGGGGGRFCICFCSK